MNGYEVLANAIIEQAAEDYRTAREKLMEDPDNRKARQAMQDIEEFFGSAWYRTLTTVDGDKILKKLKEEVNV